MGLDLYLVKNIDGLDAIGSGNEEKEEELCYGRKTWTIATFFMDRSERCYEDTDCYWRVPHSAWDEYMNYINSALDRLEDKGYEINDLIEKYRTDSDTDEEAEALEEFVDGLCDYPPTLGYDWEAQAMIDWAESDLEVCDAFEDAPKDIYLIVSY